METFVGKFLIRRSKTKDGKEVFVVCGAALPDFPISEISDRDEVWCARLMAVDIQKYVRKCPESNGYRGSPEDWLEHPDNLTGEFSEWKKKNE